VLQRVGVVEQALGEARELVVRLRAGAARVAETPLQLEGLLLVELLAREEVERGHLHAGDGAAHLRLRDRHGALGALDPDVGVGAVDDAADDLAPVRELDPVGVEHELLGLGRDVAVAHAHLVGLGRVEEAPGERHLAARLEHLEADAVGVVGQDLSEGDRAAAEAQHGAGRSCRILGVDGTRQQRKNHRDTEDTEEHRGKRPGVSELSRVLHRFPFQFLVSVFLCVLCASVVTPPSSPASSPR
jgi:hypothetical protein